MDEREVLAILSEPTRYRIVELLAEAPRTVGEVAAMLDALQPQTTKHLQTLASAELITVHRLGRRRVASIRRDTLRRLAGCLDALGVEHQSEAVLAQYSEAIAAEDARVAAGSTLDRTIRVSREIAASVDRTWRAWTTAALVRRWWAPEHFVVTKCAVRAVAGGSLRIVLREADGAEYTAIGTFLEVHPHQELRFELAPLGSDGTPLFDATHTVTFTETSKRTTVDLTIAVSHVQPDANAALAGVQIGWQQTLDRLNALLADG